MKLHGNARLTFRGREKVVRRWQGGESAQSIARGMAVSVKTVYKWLRRFEQEGIDGLMDRSSRPHRLRKPKSR